MVALMRACSRAVRDAPDETAFFAALCRAFGEIGRYPYAAICLQGAGSPQLRLAAAWRSLAVPGAAAAEDLSPSMAELVGRALRGAVPVLAPASDGEPPPDWLGIVARDAVSIAAIPFPRRSGRAALVLASQKPLSQRELNFAGALVHLIGFASEVSGAVRHHALLLSIFPVAVFEADADGNWRYVSDWWRHLSGQTATDALGRGWMDMIHPDDRPLFDPARLLRNRVSSIRCRLCTRAGDTRHVVVQIVAESTGDGADLATGIFGTITDAAAEADQEEELRYARAIADQSPVVLYRYRAGDELPVIYVSRNIERFGYSTADVLSGRLRFPAYVHAEDRGAVAATMHRLMIGEIDFAEQDYRVIAGDGSTRWIHDRTTPVRDDGGTVIALQGLLVDITERKAQDERIANLLTRDPLTGLINRASFSERLVGAIADLNRYGNSFAVHLLGLDHFKDVNDTLGHEAGDALLRVIAERLRKALRVNDVIAHMGGDQFAVLQTTLNEESTSGMVATRLLLEVAKPIPLEGHDIRITTSIGIVVCDRAGLDGVAVLRDADAALNRAKDEGRNRFRVHTDEINQAVRERVTLLEELRHALEHDELTLYYQPQFDLRDGTICGIEALLRWQHPQHGLLLPGRFIRVAEITGLIVPIGVKVLRDAVRQMKAWLDEGIAPATMSVAINLSAIQLKTATVEGDVLKAIAELGIPPERLELEVTETVFMEILDHGDNALTRLQARGVKVAIDDFGTGYSSLAYIKWLRGTRLKIAQEFVRDIPGDLVSSAVVRAVVAMARDIGIDFIAEGVEREDQARFLRDLGCYYVQGFLYGRPQTPAAVTQLLREHKKMTTPALLSVAP